MRSSKDRSTAVPAPPPNPPNAWRIQAMPGEPFPRHEPLRHGDRSGQALTGERLPRHRRCRADALLTRNATRSAGLPALPAAQEGCRRGARPLPELALLPS
jgi:hypothetical protein